MGISDIGISDTRISDIEGVWKGSREGLEGVLEGV